MRSDLTLKLLISFLSAVESEIDLMPTFQLVFESVFTNKDLASSSFAGSVRHETSRQPPETPAKAYMDRLRDEISEISSLCISGVTVGLQDESSGSSSSLQRRRSSYLSLGGAAGNQSRQPVQPGRKGDRMSAAGRRGYSSDSEDSGIAGRYGNKGRRLNRINEDFSGLSGSRLGKNTMCPPPPPPIAFPMKSSVNSVGGDNILIFLFVL